MLIRIWSGSPLGSLDTLREQVSVIDSVGATSPSVRVHVDFSQPISLLANADYWFGMSGYSDLPQYIISRGIGPFFDDEIFVYLGDGHNPAYGSDGKLHTGDMALRLEGFATGSNVPEPSTLALLGIALAGLGFSKRKLPVIYAQ